MFFQKDDFKSYNLYNRRPSRGKKGFLKNWTIPLFKSAKEKWMLKLTPSSKICRNMNSSPVEKRCWAYVNQRTELISTCFNLSKRFKFNRIMKYSNLEESWSWKVYIPAAMDKKDVERISGENLFLWKCNKRSQEVEPKLFELTSFQRS